MAADYPEIHVIVGTGRCGTSYLREVLRESLDIGFHGEPKFVIPMYRQLHRFGNLEKAANLRRLVEEIHKRKFFDPAYHGPIASVSTRPEEILERVQEPTYTGVLYAIFQLLAEKKKRSRLGYKDPSDVTHLPLLAQLLPTARFIHIIRDGRDVALSLLKFSWGATNLYSGAREWAQLVSTGRRDGVHLGDRYFELRLEDLTFNTDEVAVKLGEFINRGHYPEQVQKLVELVNRTKEPNYLQSWKQNMNENQRYLCEAAAGDVLRACGYPTEFDRKARLLPLKSAFYLSSDFALRVRNRLRRRARRPASR